VKPAKEQIEVNLEELAALVERARQGPLGEADCERLEAAIQALRYLIETIGEKNATISQLRALLMKPSTEKTRKVLEQAGIKAPARNSSPANANENKKPKPGHGRNGAQAYGGARRIKIAHGSLKSGDHCPGCLKGKVYLQKEPGLRIRVVGQAPIAAQVYELERLRCNLCGEVYEAEAPQEVGEKKYDESAEAQGLTPEARLRFHQEHSQPVMDALHAWFLAQFAKKKVEPNSGLGEAISYCLKRWDRLTLFLHQAGAPLDSNIVERALKKCILHRKNSLF